VGSTTVFSIGQLRSLLRDSHEYKLQSGSDDYSGHGRIHVSHSDGLYALNNGSLVAMADEYEAKTGDY